MATPGTAPIQISLDPVSTDAATDELLTAVLRANPYISDLIFSPGRKLQVQVHGALHEISILNVLTADHTRRIASDLIGNNKAAINILREQGYCDVSYAIAGLARFRVNIFIQRGSCAIVMRVIPTVIPELKNLGAPEELRTVATLRHGLVLVTGPRGSGKSSTLAALLNDINENWACHIITIEDPIEFLHCHKKATVHQRELHSDTPSAAHAMRAALRQAPNVIVVGELKNRETMELALEAAETGHLVLATVNTLNAQKTVERIVHAFPSGEHEGIRERLRRTLRWIVCQRLIPRKLDGERVAVFEIVHADSPQLSFQKGAKSAAAAESSSGRQGLDREIEQLVRRGTVSLDAALAHALDPSTLASKFEHQS